MTKKEIVNVLTGEKEVRDLTSAEETELQNMKVANEASEAEQAEKDANKASAKAKLIAGEALTEAEADTVVL